MTILVWSPSPSLANVIISITTQTRMGVASSAWTATKSLLITTSGTVGDVRINTGVTGSSAALIINGVIRVEATTQSARIRLVLIDGIRQHKGAIQYVPASGATADSLGPLMLNGIPVAASQSESACSG